MRKLYILLAMAAAIGFKSNSLKGFYKYAGGTTNGKYEKSLQEFTLERRYDNNGFEAFVLEDKQPPFKYQSGTYKINGDSCLETETFNAQSAALTGKTIRFGYKFHKDTLILKGTLPNGNKAEEYWVRQK